MPKTGGIYNSLGNYHSTLTLVNTILANGAGANCDGPINDGGYNLESGNSCGLSSANHSLVNTDPQLDPNGLQWHGGNTQTIALQPSSPAVTSGNVAVCQSAPVSGKDQRGMPRPTSYCDMGAYDSSGVPAFGTGTATTSTALDLSASSVPRGKMVILTATVTKSLDTPLKGKVVFRDGSIVVGVATLKSGGIAQANFETTNQITKIHDLTAQFYGDDTYAPSISAKASLYIS